jgi:hypothetical protein
MLKTILAWCKDSETIAIARAKFIIGAVFTAVQQSGVDLTALTDKPGYKIAIQVFMAYLVVDGTLTEWARRRRAADL